MKRIQNKIYLGLVILGLSAPLQVYAAGEDSVMLGQDGNQVAVSLEMSNAAEEKITTVAVSLEVKTDNPGQVTVDFQFAPGLGETEHGFVYHEDTGRLDIYVASSKTLFTGEKLNLGNVQVQPVDSGKSLSADISYCPNSFQTANGAYGNKTPVVGEVESVSIQIGNGTLAPTTPDTGSPGTGNTGNGAGSSEGSNRDQGLYDDTTRFTNDPANAQKIDASIVERDKTSTLFNHLTAGAASAIGGKNNMSNVIGQTKGNGKVNVISPENGPASILVSKDGDGQPDGLLGGMNGENSDGDAWGEGNSQGNGSEEIMLDQKNGGAVDNRKNEKRKQIITFGASCAGIIAVVSGGIFLFLKRKKLVLIGAKKKKKKRRRYRKKPVNRRRSRGRRKPANKRASMSGKGETAARRRKPVRRKRKRRPVRE